ncbi:MAG: DUF1800 domain-containing protein [Acidobacteria bacterium]|nr:DUF1800 domain-containing protein [Acidobacteriota bacterium]
MAHDQLIEHLLRRAGFGASAEDLAAYTALSYGAAVDRLVDYENQPDSADGNIGKPGFAGTTSQNPFSPNTVINDARQRWLFRMLHSPRPLEEKMTLFWHNHFATGYTKVAGAVGAENGTRLMAAKAAEDPGGQRGQVELFRQRALGSVRDLLIEVAKDPAMLYWLDGATNTKARPQENFGRELMELFTRGVGYYTESDVYAAARVFTGWNVAQPGRGSTTAAISFQYNAGQHETGAKTFSFPIYGDGGRTIPARAARDGMQDGIDLLTALAYHPETARRLAARLYGYFVSETTAPDPGFVDQIAAVYLQSGTAMRPVVRFILNSAEFRDARVYFTRYSWPAEYVVRAIKEIGWEGFSLGSTLTPLDAMGQQLFSPPDVAGWTLGEGWFSTGAMLARMNFASTLASSQKVHLATAARPSRQSAQAVLDFLLDRLTPADFGMQGYDDLLAYAGAGAAWTGADVQLQAKASGLAHLIAGSPEYQFV